MAHKSISGNYIFMITCKNPKCGKKFETLLEGEKCVDESQHDAYCYYCEMLTRYEVSIPTSAFHYEIGLVEDSL